MSERAREIAAVRYSEQASRARHLDYFTALEPGASPFDPKITPR